MNIKNIFYSSLVIASFSVPVFSATFDNLEVTHDAEIKDDLHVLGQATIENNVHARKNLRVSNDFFVTSLNTGIAQIAGNKLVAGDLPTDSVDTTQIVNDAVTLAKIEQPLSGDLSVSGNVFFNGSDFSVIGSRYFSNLNVVFGSVAANGTILSGQGFSVVRNSEGNYTVTFTNSFDSVNCYQVLAQISNNNNKMGFVFVDKTNASNFNVETFQTPSNTWAPAAKDRIFHFIAIGN